MTNTARTAYIAPELVVYFRIPRATSAQAETPARNGDGDEFFGVATRHHFSADA